MAQPTPTPPADGLPRPLPRGGRLAAKNTRPRFQPIDAAWMAVLAAVFVGLSVWALGLRGMDWSGTVVGAVTVMLTYLLGWRASGRVAGIAGGLLLATSAVYLFFSPGDHRVSLFTLLTMASLFAFVAGSSLAALGLAALAAGFRADGAMLGLILLTLTVAQHRQRAWLGAVLFVVVAAGALYMGFFSQSLPLFSLGSYGAPWAFLLAPPGIFLLWFLLPLCGELGDPVRRARWLPVVLWALLAPVLSSFVLLGAPGLFPSLPLLPLLFVLAGGGLARLMPALSGDFPAPFVRYVLATLAVISLVALNIRQEWPIWHSAPAPAPMQAVVPARATPPAPVVIPAPTPAPIITPAEPVATAPKPAAITKPVPVVKKPHLIALPHAKVAPPAKPAVPLYHIVNGRRVKRSSWAIQWDKTHRGP